jgi:hypothetical protein
MSLAQSEPIVSLRKEETILREIQTRACPLVPFPHALQLRPLAPWLPLQRLVHRSVVGVLAAAADFQAEAVSRAVPPLHPRLLPTSLLLPAVGAADARTEAIFIFVSKSKKRLRDLEPFFFGRPLSQNALEI